MYNSIIKHNYLVMLKIYKFDTYIYYILNVYIQNDV